MERKYLFRGKTIATNEWIYGGLAVIDNLHYIVKLINYECGTSSLGTFAVAPESVGQYIDQTDENDIPIFEGDIIYNELKDQYAEIRWDPETSRFVLLFDDYRCGALNGFEDFDGFELNVVGNIFDGGDNNGRL